MADMEKAAADMFSSNLRNNYFHEFLCGNISYY